MKHSKVWAIEKGELQDMVDQSSTMVEILDNLGLNTHNGNHRTLKKRILFDNISLEKFNINHSIFIKRKRLELEKPFNDVFCDNSLSKGHGLKKRILKEKLLEYECKKCGCNGVWLGDKLVLQIEHINGKNNDNRIENLCFLCPNCHSQTKTYSGRNRKTCKKISSCSCGEPKHKTAKSCIKCRSQMQIKLPNLTKEELEKMMKEMPITRIAKQLGISDNGVRKYAIRMGINRKILLPI